MGNSISFIGLGERSATVLQGVRNDIANGIYPVGAMIPRQEALAERFQCTKPTVQKAIARLVEEGWLSTKRGAGTFVTRASAPEAHPSTAIAVMFTEDSHDLSDLQKIIMGTNHMLSVYQQTPFFWSPDRERQFLETVLQNRCLGLVAICTPKPPLNEDLLEKIAAQGTHVVHVEPYSMSLPDQDFVLPDYRQAGQTAATSLMLAGYRNIMFANMADSPFERLIEAGFSQALHDQGRDYTPDAHRFRVHDTQQHPDKQALLERDIQQIPPSTGILCRSANNALTFQKILRQQGRALPEDIGLITMQCDCEPACETVDTLLLDRRPMMEKAVDHIINGRGRRLRQLISPKLIRRGTVRLGSGTL